MFLCFKCSQDVGGRKCCSINFICNQPTHCCVTFTFKHLLIFQTGQHEPHSPFFILVLFFLFVLFFLRKQIHSKIRIHPSTEDLQPDLKTAPFLNQWQGVWIGISRPMSVPPNQDTNTVTKQSKWTLGAVNLQHSLSLMAHRLMSLSNTSAFYNVMHK